MPCSDSAFLKHSDNIMNNWFQFKQFKIVQEQTAMKVGTDGVLLGAWADTTQSQTILDVGTGTGVIALMMAQRSQARITGIEIEEKAAEEATFNAYNSPWSNRIQIINTSLQDFEANHPKPFDLIISNPPFFTNSKRSASQSLAIAKHNHLLPYTSLISCSARMLSPQGRIALIVPVDETSTIRKLAECHKLFLLRETLVRPNNLKKPHRTLLEFGNVATKPVDKDVLNIHNDDGMDFTETYKQLTRSFYLYF